MAGTCLCDTLFHSMFSTIHLDSCCSSRWDLCSKRLYIPYIHVYIHTLKCCCCHAVWGGIPHTKIAQHKLDCHLPCIHSWLRISWHLERLSIVSLSYEHFSHDTGVTACPLFEAVIESWQLIPKQAMTQLVTLSFNLVTQKMKTTQKTTHNETLQKWATLSNTVTRYSLSQTLMSNASQYIATKGFRYIYYICRW